MPVIDRIKSDFTNVVVSSCSERGCTLRLDGLSNHVVLKGERTCKDRRICDCIIFTRDNCIIIGIVELKSKTIHSSEIVEKLTNGSEMALNILEKCSDISIEFEFYHLVLCKRWHTSQYKVIISKKIIVRGKRYGIIPKRCGVSFSTVISSLR